MSAVEQDRPLLTLTRQHVRLLVLAALLLVLIGFALGYRWLTVQQVAEQALGGAFGMLGALVLGVRR